MKKCVCFLLAICFALTACGGDPIDTGKNPPSGGSGENPCDYTIAVDSGEAINILQITDPQITEGGTEQLKVFQIYRLCDRRVSARSDHRNGRYYLREIRSERHFALRADRLF